MPTIGEGTAFLPTLRGGGQPQRGCGRSAARSGRMDRRRRHTHAPCGWRDTRHAESSCSTSISVRSRVVQDARQVADRAAGRCRIFLVDISVPSCCVWSWSDPALASACSASV